MPKVYIARHHAEAHHVQGLLASEGIEAEVRGEHLFAVNGAPAIPSMCPSVWVLREDQVPLAQDLILRYTKDEGVPQAEPWQCPTCGEKHEAQFTNCWKCGASR